MRKDYSCLEAFVGLRHYCDVAEAVGVLFVDDLPGVETSKFVAAATVDDLTGKEMFLRLRREASRRTAKDFLARLETKFAVEEVAERVTLGDVDTDYMANTATYKLVNNYPQTSLHLEVIKVYAEQAGQITITVNDVASTHAVLAGYNTFTRDDQADTLTITVTGVDGLRFAYGYRHYYDCGRCAEQSGTLPGIITFAVRCDQIICLFAEDLADATRYMTAALLMEEVEFSDRTNPLVRNGKESAGRIRARILGGEDPVTEIRNSSLYKSAIDAVVARAKLSGPCVTCKGLAYVEQTP